MATPWRRGLYNEIRRLKLDGDIIDLGGSRNSSYHELIGGIHKINVVNLDDNSGLDLKFDLEKNFPLLDETYNCVLAMNVSNHR